MHLLQLEGVEGAAVMPDLPETAPLLEAEDTIPLITQSETNSKKRVCSIAVSVLTWPVR